MAYLAGYSKLNDRQAIGGSFRYFSLGNIDYFDDNAQSTGSGKPNELELSGAYARKLSEEFSAAISLKFIYSYLVSDRNIGGNDIKPGVAAATDISFSYKHPVGKNMFAAGLALTNLGTKYLIQKAARNTYRQILASDWLIPGTLINLILSPSPQMSPNLWCLLLMLLLILIMIRIITR